MRIKLETACQSDKIDVQYTLRHIFWYFSQLINVFQL